ncbi:response regulator [Fulvivirga sp. M361]|uniref:response regulator n=1 Tax=Fulvivirga sp. M361 TaxID=2594266 RepID=UPI00117B9E2E|nr:response regulator [Fulvivirga sp. M361]TRX60600.1 response regulator [Fulvivirga sp. M361]
MDNLYIICVDDQQEVLNALEQDLSLFDEKMNVEVCDSAGEALELMDEIDQQGDFVALIISDQVMPEMTGTTFLAAVRKDSRFHDTRKMLLTGQATHQDTIQAINTGGIVQYVEKPWQKDILLANVKTLLSHFVMTKGLDYQEFIDLLDQEVIYQWLRNRT